MVSPELEAFFSLSSAMVWLWVHITTGHVPKTGTPTLTPRSRRYLYDSPDQKGIDSSSVFSYCSQIVNSSSCAPISVKDTNLHLCAIPLPAGIKSNETPSQLLGSSLLRSRSMGMYLESGSLEDKCLGAGSALSAGKTKPNSIAGKSIIRSEGLWRSTNNVQVVDILMVRVTFGFTFKF